jgi:hypothetical protein
MVIPAKATIQAILDAEVGKFHDPPKVDFITNPILPDPVSRRPKELIFFLLFGREEKKDSLVGKFMPLHSGSNRVQKFLTNHKKSKFGVRCLEFGVLIMKSCFFSDL